MKANEQRPVAVERHWTVGGSTELNQFIYFKDIIFHSWLQWKVGNVLFWRRDHTFVSTGTNSYGFSKINKDQIWSEEISWEFWLQKWGRKPEKIAKEVTYKLIPQHEISSETGWDMVNLVGYRFHNGILFTQATGQTDLWSWRMTFICLNRKQNVFTWLVHTSHSILVLRQMCMLP